LTLVDLTHVLPEVVIVGGLEYFRFVTLAFFRDSSWQIALKILGRMRHRMFQSLADKTVDAYPVTFTRVVLTVRLLLVSCCLVHVVWQNVFNVDEALTWLVTRSLVNVTNLLRERIELQMELMLAPIWRFRVVSWTHFTVSVPLHGLRSSRLIIENLRTAAFPLHDIFLTGNKKMFPNY